MSWWERAYLPEILRGLSITGGVFLTNMWRWMTFRKGALTTYYPEETRADYAANNRGKHVLTQRPDGRPQCIACNMCATVCPAKVIEIEAGFDPDDPAHPKYPGALRDRLFALHILRVVRRGLPGGRDPHGQGSAEPADVRSQQPVAVAPRVAQLEPATRRREALSGEEASTGHDAGDRHDRDLAALALRRHGARRRRPDARAAPPDARRAGADGDDAFAGRRLRAARRARDRGVPGAHLRRRGDGVHGLRDHAPRRARPLVHAPLLAAAAARNRRRAAVSRDTRARLVACAARAHRRGGRHDSSACSTSRPNS